MMKRELYGVTDNKVERKRRFCPRCGPGVFLAEHKDRFTCGKCGYTEFRKETSEKPKTTRKKAQ
ncbi:MAG: 30S ribosomal protein S27ae [Candidatus Thermoplasmatota archaeon]|jgi:small subunit ribosomal protein S27Ae|nr:30S ribosomal protein S27ae [Candidatus Thermoplasmatota archaeon]